MNYGQGIGMVIFGTAIGNCMAILYHPTGPLYFSVWFVTAIIGVFGTVLSTTNPIEGSK